MAGSGKSEFGDPGALGTQPLRGKVGNCYQAEGVTPMSTRTNRVIFGTALVLNVLLLIFLPVRDAANVLLITIAVKSTALTALYGIRSPWRTTSAGRALLLLVSSIAAITTQGAVTILTHADYPYRDQIRDALFVYVALALLWLLLTVFRIQQDAADELGDGRDRAGTSS
jgi:hypothetical protein